ncbi:unnamed protein product [Closterium sp. NIES-54]
MRDRSSGVVYICDVTITDPISTRDPNATKGRGWAAREMADKKKRHYANRPDTVAFFPLAVDTYGCPCAEFPEFLKLLADTAARRHFNAQPHSFQAARFLHLFRQRWSMALQRAQSMGYLIKSSQAVVAENPPVGGVQSKLHLGDCCQGTTAATQPGSNTAARPSTAAQRRQLAQCPVGTAGRQGPAASRKQGQAPRLSQGSPAPARLQAASAASPSLPPRPPPAPAATLPALGEDRVGRVMAMTEAAEAATSGGAATGWEAEGELAAGTTADAGGDSASPRATSPAVTPLPEIHGRVEEQEHATAATQVMVPAPQAQTVVTTSAAVGADIGPAEGGGMIGAGSAKTPAAAVGTDTQGCDQVAGDTHGRGNGVAVHATRGKGRKKLRAQPAPRRPGAGLFFLPVQFGVSDTGGAECIIHAVRSLLKEDKTRVALQLDIENAFNSVERPAFFHALSQSNLLSLLPLVRTLYEGPSRLLVDHRLGVDQILSSRGVRQGDPLGPLLFAAAIQPTLLSTATPLPEVAIVAYADDITIVGPRDAAFEAFINITTELTSLGLRCNIATSTGWGQSTEEGSEIPPPHGLPINTTGIGVLGSPIGTPTFCTDQAQTRLMEASAPLPLIAQLHPQHAMLMLSRSISRRISYMLRTTPAAVLEKEDWRSWSKSLLGAALAAAKLHVPISELEQSLLWRQGTLPIRLGGLGIIDPSSEAPAAYIASVTAAQQLLRHMNLPEAYLLRRAITLLDHAWSPAVPEVNQLEAALPAPARAALQAFREKPTGQGNLQLVLSCNINERRAAKLLSDTITDRPGTHRGHAIRLISLQGVGAGDWLHALPSRADLTFAPGQFSLALGFRMGKSLPLQARVFRYHRHKPTEPSPQVWVRGRCAAKKKYRQGKLAMTTARLTAHYRQRWSVMLHWSQATSYLNKSNLSDEAAFPQAARDPWEPSLGDLWQVLEDNLEMVMA